MNSALNVLRWLFPSQAPKADPGDRSEYIVHFDDEARDARPRTLVLLLDLGSKEVSGLVPGLVERIRNAGREPIFAVSAPVFDVFREHDVIVELVPTLEHHGSSSVEQVNTYRDDRLQSIRASWNTDQEIDLSSDSARA